MCARANVLQCTQWAKSAKKWSGGMRICYFGTQKYSAIIIKYTLLQTAFSARTKLKNAYLTLFRRDHDVLIFAFFFRMILQSGNSGKQILLGHGWYRTFFGR